MAYKFNFFTPGSEAPEYSYIFSFLGIILLFFLSMLGLSLWFGNVLIGAVGSIVIAVILYLLVRRLELIKVGQVDSSPAVVWVGLILSMLLAITTSYHYLHNYMADTNNLTELSSDSFIGMKAKELRATSDLYNSYAGQLKEMKSCENGILDIESAIVEAQNNKSSYQILAANIKNPLKIMEMSKPLGSTFDLHKREITAGFTTETIGECNSPLPVLNKFDFDKGYQDYGPMASLTNMNPIVFFPLLLLIPVMLLLPYLMAGRRIENLKANPFHQRKKR